MDEHGQLDTMEEFSAEFDRQAADVMSTRTGRMLYYGWAVGAVAGTAAYELHRFAARAVDAARILPAACGAAWSLSRAVGATSAIMSEAAGTGEG